MLKYEYKDSEFTALPRVGNGHAGPVRGVSLSQNDYMMVTQSFDQVNVWALDYNAKKGQLNIDQK